MTIGDKVVSLITFAPISANGNVYSNGAPVKDGVYVVRGFVIDQKGELGLQLVGKWTHSPSGKESGWWVERFRKLEQHRAEQELAYYRSEPTKVHA